MTTRRTIAPEELDTLDLADPRLHAETDLSAVWRHLRQRRPVHLNPATDTAPAFWVVTRHADVTAVYRDSARFTSEGGNVLETLLAGGDTAAGRMLPITDGEKHAGLRRVLMSAFSLGALEPIVASVRRTVQRLLEEALDKGSCDFASDVAARIPLGAICDLLGVPDRDRAHVLSLTSAALGSHDADSTPADAWIARNEILLYFAELARDRRESGHSDVIALLAGSEVNGLPLDDDEIMLNCYSLILGGDETARLSMAGAALALLEHPGQWQALKRGDAPIGTAVEEILRWTTPALHAGRTATTDTEIGGHPVRAATSSPSGTPPPTTTSWSSTPRASYGWTAPPTSTSPSPTAPTSASAPISPARSSAPCWPGCATSSRRWSAPVPRDPSTPTSSADSAPCRSR